MPPVKQRTPELRGHILETAFRVLEAGGVGAFTVRRLAAAAATSAPAIYELFGDKAGLVRELFFEGFRRLAAAFLELPESGDPRHDLMQALDAFRSFVGANPELAAVMFSTPFADFAPGTDEAAAGEGTRAFLVARVQRCIDAGLMAGDAVDLAHVVLAVAQGLAAQERAGWLGTSTGSINRRWRTVADALLR
jgi:AcrR family transcriptional regulator